MNELTIFNYEQKEVRTVQIDGEPWFVAKDVCDVLDLKDHRTSINLLDDDERHTVPVTDALGRNQETFIINEPGLYSLIIRSRKPEAKAFKRWITHEVLPTIRKTGTYTAPQQQTVKVPALLDTDKAFRAALRMAKACGLDNNAAIIKANQLARRVTGNDAMALLEIQGVERPVEDRQLTPTEIGKFLGNISGQKVNKLLVEAGMQTKTGDIYSLPQTDTNFPYCSIPASSTATGHRFINSSGSRALLLSWDIPQP